MYTPALQPRPSDFDHSREMAVASEYSGWVRELDNYQEAADGVDNDDPRHETSKSELVSSRRTSRTAIGMGTSRKSKTRALSQTDELQQEMKLLNWHKLANEAALKAAIIKTNKIKREDSHLTRSMTYEDTEDKQLRIQQIIEEEQLRPLEVNSEFFRDFETREQRNEAKLETDVQRHVQHLKRLKEVMAQREDMQRRRQKYREGMLELQGENSRSSSVPKDHRSNQEDDHLDQQSVKRHQRSNSMYNNRASATGGAVGGSAQVICSLDKLMELEKRIRHLEDAGLGADELENDHRVDRNGDAGGDEMDDSSFAKKGGSRSLHFSKRRSASGPYEPSKTVYTVKSSSDASKANKVCAKEKPKPAVKVGATRQSKPPATFLTSLPENKQRQLRRMSERERRQFIKHEKATEERAKSFKQDVVIDGWLEKKRQAATNRKAVTSHVRNAQPGRGVRGSSTSTGASSSSRAVVNSRLHGSKAVPPPPKVRAPAVGAASGKRIANPHLQKFDDLKKGFERRNEALKRAPTSLKPGAPVFDARVASGSANRDSSTRSRSTRLTSSSERSTTGYRASAALSFASRSSASNSTTPSLAIAPPKKSPSVSSQFTKLPAITRAPGVVSGPQFGLSNARAPVARSSLSHSSNQAAVPPNPRVGTLPRLVPQTLRAPPAPSPPPQASRNPSMPQFSRLHKR